MITRKFLSLPVSIAEDNIWYTLWCVCTLARECKTTVTGERASVVNERDLYHTDLLFSEISTEVCNCQNNSCTFQWTSQQPVMVDDIDDSNFVSFIV